MTESHLSTPAPIGDEMLSAYIDGQLNAADLQRVEKALATDAQAQERYETLRMTVSLMQDAPPVRVPRAFTLSEAQVLAAGGKVKGVEQPGFWERLFPRLMPLATAAVALLLVVLVSADLLPGFSGGGSIPQSAREEMEIAAAPVQDIAVSREMPAESAVADTEIMALEVEEAVSVEKEMMMATVVVEKLMEREEGVAGDAAAGVAPLARSAAKMSPEQSTPMALPTTAMAEAQMAAAPPPAAAEEMAADEVEPMLEMADAPAEMPAEEPAASTQFSVEPSPTVETNIARTAPVAGKDGKPSWLRPLEVLLALLFVCLLVATLLLRKRTRTDTP